MGIRYIGNVVALILPLWIACSLAKAEVPAPATPATSTLAELQQVPPNGLESLDEKGFRYFQTMGPLEHATRLGGIPDTPTWRVRVRLYPVWQTSEFLYHVKLDHYNLSPALYQALVDSHGAENVDPSLNSTTPHLNIGLEFLPVMNMAADWLPASTQIEQSVFDTATTCGLGLDCTAIEEPNNSTWATETTIDMDVAPWDSDNEPLYMLVRALAKQAGWLQEDWILPNEIPEGISAERPWVEVLVTNYAGNGGGYLATWIEHTADDSIRSIVHQIYYEATWMDMSGSASTGYVCSRGRGAGEIRPVCP